MDKVKAPKNELFIVDFNALVYLDNFLISTVSAIIFIRVYLAITGYPVIGGDSLHIAHMLWGGLIMMATLISLLAFINKNVKTLGSIVGGIGFGVFIDELGKFITHDNNYFFQPTFALLYVLLLLIYFSFRKIFSIIEKDDKEFVMNALELLKEAVFFDLDQNEKRKLSHYLTMANKNQPLAKELIKIIAKLEVKQSVDTRYMRLKNYLRKLYLDTLKSRHFVFLLYILLSVGSITNILLVTNIILSFTKLTFWNVGFIASVSLASAFTIWGVLQFIKRNSLLAYLYLRRATIVSILFVQFFAFYYHQLTALIPLLTAFVTYVGIQSLLEEHIEYK